VLQKRTARPLPGLTLIRGVRWFDAPAATMRGPADVYLRAGRIADVTPPGQLAAQPDQVIDGQGRTLLPGLWDMHAHLWAGAAPLHLVAGVTSVRDMAGDNANLMRLQARLAAGELPGPTVYLAGFIEGRSPYSARNGFVVDSVDEGRRAIDWYAARGYRQIKLYNSIKPEWVRPLAAHAKARGLKVSGHVPAFMLAEQAVRAGYDELTHINQVTLNFVTQPGDDPRTLLRFTRIGDDAHRLNVDSPRVRAFVALLVKHGTVVDPTLAAFESMFTQQQGQPNPGLLAMADHLPAVWRRNLRAAEMDLEGTKLTTYRASYARMLALTRAMHRAGVPLVAGTDAVPGLSLHRELELYVQAGIPAAQALRIATWNGARAAGAEHEAGSIARGKVADLMLVDGDPSRRIADIRRASLVLKGGVAYAPAQLFEAMGFRPVVDGARIESTAAAR
jgi:imidazolonepropionase-like amidohydrolase